MVGAATRPDPPKLPESDGRIIDMSINRVSITGNLTRDPELRATAGGTQVCVFVAEK